MGFYSPTNYSILIQNWGYWIMFAAAIIEGETFLVLGGIAAAEHILYFKYIMLLSIIGCLLHDFFLFFLGKFLSPKILINKPKLQDKVNKISIMIDKYSFWLILGFRFAYGLRTVIPFAIGISKIKILKFIGFDIIGSIIWVLVFLLAGYYFSNFIEMIFFKCSLFNIIKKNWIIFIISIFLIILKIILLNHWFYQRKKKQINEK